MHAPFIDTYKAKCPPWWKWFLELKYILDLDERLKQERNHKSNKIYNKATPKCEETLHFSKVEKTKAVV